MEHYAFWIILFAGFYFSIGASWLSAKNFRSFVLFKAIPYALGVFLMAFSIHNLFFLKIV